MIRRSILEVERKFRSLAVRELTQYAGSPPFQSLKRLPTQIISDAYFDTPDRRLSSMGAWVRKRNGDWEAKIKLGGDYNNSRFEEILGHEAVAACIGDILRGEARVESNPDLGLHPIASFVTSRQNWTADNDFHIVLDSMDFGHEVGEIELQQAIEASESDKAQDEMKKQKVMQAMDKRIATFMRHYAWAFTPGKPVGKLTAYFDKMRMRST